MSEDDYQRGLRGGDCPVPISDWERYSDWKDGRDEYERRLDRELDAVASGRRSDDLGEFDCPHCLQRSLKEGASRCPLCRGRVGRDYWRSALAQREKEESVRLAREAREREESEAREAAWEEEWRSKQRTEARKEARFRIVQGCLFGVLYGGVFIGLAGCVNCFRNLGEINTPGFLMRSFNLLTGVFYGAIAGAVAGPLIAIVYNKIIEGREPD